MSELFSIITNAEGDRRLGEHLIMWAKTRRMRKIGESKDMGWPPTLEQFMLDVGAVYMQEDGSTDGADIQVPKRLKTIQFLQSNMETLLVRLPPSELVEASEARIAAMGAGDPYPIPEFYERILNGTLTDKTEIFRSRVGDYTIAHCK